MPPSDFSSPEESTKEVTGEEDCLYLNVWTPQNASSDLSVMLWIHGGNLAWGFASDPGINGTSLAIDENIIVVTINYRLSIFGFSNAPEIPLENQNAGFLDQRLALDWVQKNIHNFGGNASKVTVAGQSAGAYSVQQLLASPPNPLPYRAAIVESFARGLPGNGTEAYLNVSNQFNCTNLACLRDLPSEAIRKYAFEAGLDFPPTYDKGTCVQNLTAQVDSGNFAQVPFVLGSTKDELSEMVYYLSAEETDPVNATWERVSDRLVSTGLQHKFDASQLRSQLGHEPSTYAEAVRLATDIVFTCPTGAFGNYTADKGFENWRFRWSAPIRGDRIIDDLGALHGSEVPAVFGTYPRDVPPKTAALTGYAQKVWSNFVKNLETFLQSDKKLTQRILHAGVPSLNLPAFVFGPYGGAHSFGQNGTVVFALEDIGLLRALPFIRDLVEGSRERTNKVRRLEVLWQTEYSKFILTPHSEVVLMKSTVCTGEKLRERVARITQREKCPSLSIVNLDMEAEPCVMRTTGGGEDPLGVEYVQYDDSAAPQRQGPDNSVHNTAVPSYKRNGGIFEDSTRGIPLVLLEDNNHARWVRSKILDGYKR
ncbi:hypothetical protein N7478_010112 [Penicillium angulare]|uniref:uncharacterized protein n=1 Tax=Penicillium angulare TaxID=116970 RepID=UPI00253FB7B2|nr:uncharacterized protein N7478_010112 [Penicillium angulare]KAJ5267304.1 hypothetical protein N7478_010112 [Penicillium angulare]